jgi:hypothetical protein
MWDDRNVGRELLSIAIVIKTKSNSKSNRKI